MAAENIMQYYQNGSQPDWDQGGGFSFSTDAVTDSINSDMSTPDSGSGGGGGLTWLSDMVRDGVMCRYNRDYATFLSGYYPFEETPLVCSFSYMLGADPRCGMASLCDKTGCFGKFNHTANL